MKSFCIKTNNTNIINYLLKRFSDSNIENIYYRNNELNILFVIFAGKMNLDYIKMLLYITQVAIYPYFSINYLILLLIAL